MRKQLYTTATNAITRALGFPAYLILFVSDRCPNRCVHCWYSTEWKRKNLGGPVLSLDELENLSRSIKTIKFLTITGGEAFLRDDIQEIVRAFVLNSHISRFDIPTSGFDPDGIPKTAEKILIANPNTPFRIDVSLDGTKDLHNSIRNNPNAFEHAIATIGELRKLKKHFPQLDVSIITTISDANNSEVPQIGELVREVLPDGEWMINIIRGDSPGLPISEATRAAYVEANVIIAERLARKEFTGDRGHRLGRWLTAKNSLRRDMIMDTIDNKRRGGGCAAGCLTVAVLADGDVRACEMLPLSFGNLRDFNYDLPAMMLSTKGNEIRKEIQESECVCTHECNLSVSILLQPSCWPKLIKKRIAENR